MNLQETDYGTFLQNEPPPLAPAVFERRCVLSLLCSSRRFLTLLSVTVAHPSATAKWVSEFQHLRAHAVEPLATFLDYIT